MAGGSSGASQPKPLPATPASGESPPAEPGDVEIVLTSDALARLGLKTARVEAMEARSAVEVPGTVRPHGYREVRVTPIAGGIVRAVHAELGASVRRDAPLATLFLGDRHVVYLPAKGDGGRFVQRSVRLGPPTADGYAVLSGLQPGEVVVTEGSFFLRAEAVRNIPS